MKWDAFGRQPLVHVGQRRAVEPSVATAGLHPQSNTKSILRTSTWCRNVYARAMTGAVDGIRHRQNGARRNKFCENRLTTTQIEAISLYSWEEIYMNAFTNADPNSHSVESTLNPTSFSTVDGPMPLHRAVPRTNAYPVASLGEELSAVVHAIQQRVQSPIELCAQSTLAVVAMASQAIIDVRLPHGEIRGTSLSLISIASSGERKSATERI